MGNRHRRKKIRAVKETRLRKEIRELLAEDERFLRVALGVHKRHSIISMDETIALVMDEYRKSVMESYSRGANF